MIRTFNYPLKPTRSQELRLLEILGSCQKLYNTALEQRILGYRRKVKVSKYDQQKELTDLRKEDPTFGSISTVILRSSLDRLDKAYQGFFRRVKSGQTPGFPRFKSRDRYDSFSFLVSTGVNILEENQLLIPKLGRVKLHLYRPLKGIPKQVHIRRNGDKWTASIVVELPDGPSKSLNPTSNVGIDLGLAKFATFSDGSSVENPRFYRSTEEILKRLNQDLSRKKRGSNSRTRAKERLRRAHARVANQRLDFSRKLAKEVVSKFDVISYEDLKISEMVEGSRLAKSINDASWRQFTQCLRNKAEEAGKWAIGVDPKNTSQMCSGCGILVKKELKDRIHKCESCGLEIDRDLNAAINVQRLGLSLVNSLISKEIKETEVFRDQK